MCQQLDGCVWLRAPEDLHETMPLAVGRHPLVQAAGQIVQESSAEHSLVQTASSDRGGVAAPMQLQEAHHRPAHEAQVVVGGALMHVHVM